MSGYKFPGKWKENSKGFFLPLTFFISVDSSSGTRIFILRFPGILEPKNAKKSQCYPGPVSESAQTVSDVMGG